jgi:hypothetical protein
MFHNRGVVREDDAAVRAEQARCKASLAGGGVDSGCLYVALDRRWMPDFPIRQLQVAVDGALWVRMDALESGGIPGEPRSWSLPVAALPAGEHVIAVRVFTSPVESVEPRYLTTYRFNIDATHRLEVGAGAGKTVRVIAYTKPTKLVEDAFAVRFEEGSF